ncbi:MAG: hypothetical protein ABIQ95_06565 [Bdellovibrionia bacterium]
MKKRGTRNFILIIISEPKSLKADIVTTFFSNNRFQKEAIADNVTDKGLGNALQFLKLVEEIYACSKKLQGNAHHS